MNNSLLGLRKNFEFRNKQEVGESEIKLPAEEFNFNVCWHDLISPSTENAVTLIVGLSIASNENWKFLSLTTKKV